jgi:translation elongation factor EF-Tu-like GTPase
MSRLLFTIEDRFLIQDRGLVVVPGLSDRDDKRFRVGDPILLKRPDGTELTWPIGGFEMIERADNPRARLGIPILLRGLDKDDVPVDTEVWSVDVILGNP